MRLWTIQPIVAVSILESKGVFRCDTKLSVNYEDFSESYLWLVSEMDKRNIYHPDHVTLPLWAWHTRAFNHKKPDFRTIGLGNTGERYACVEFEIDDNAVLLSDYNKWHYVLNNMWLDNSENEEEWDRLQNWYDTRTQKEKERIKIESWQRIFDVTPKQTEWTVNGEYVQATFWELRKNMVKDIKYFTAK